jgi:beta-glucosidase
MTRTFPDSFQWGVSTAAYQIEGAASVAGRKPSVWDTFSETPGRTIDGKSGAVACDHYHRYLEDIAWMKRLGVTHYRFSLAWARILPDGTGAVNAQGLAFYDRLIDALLAAGITPYVTLFHWDSPQALEQAYGSWRSRQMAYDFADYVTVAVKHLGDRVRHWFTINEIFCFTHLGYEVGKVPVHAPGTQVSQLKEVWQTSHHALLAHGLGTQAIRAASPQPCSVALVDNFLATVPLVETPEHIEAARKAFGLCGTNGGILFPALTGEYDPRLLAQLGSQAPDIQPGDLEIIHQPLDVFGFNIYAGMYVRAKDNAQGFEIMDFPAGYPKLNMPWLYVLPEGLYWGVRHIAETLNQPNLPIVISENGCATQDQVNAKGEIWDCDRIFYLRQYLHNAERAIREGYPLQGYFQWTLLDNFEWSWGYERRFGLLYTDYATQQRTPKASFDWYKACIQQGRVV